MNATFKLSCLVFFSLKKWGISIFDVNKQLVRRYIVPEGVVVAYQPLLLVIQFEHNVSECLRETEWFDDTIVMSSTSWAHSFLFTNNNNIGQTPHIKMWSKCIQILNFKDWIAYSNKCNTGNAYWYY